MLDKPDSVYGPQASGFLFSQKFSQDIVYFTMKNTWGLLLSKCMSKI